MGLVLDTGALIAYDRGDRRVAALVARAHARKEPIITSSGCVAQAWRSSGRRHAQLARLLNGSTEMGLDQAVSKVIGRLCAESGTSDVVDAHVVVLARSGDVLVTSDPTDLAALLAVTSVDAVVQHC